MVALLAWVLLLGVRPASAATGGPVRVEQGAVPPWVLPVPAGQGVEATESGGVALLVVDDQTRAVGRDLWRFKRRVARLTSEAGLRAWGELKLEFDPPAERLVMHAVRVRRGSESVSKLELGKIAVLQRERALEEYGVYDGTRTAVAVLSDLRIGDVIELEYSLVGNNPVFGGHVTELWPTRQTVEIGYLRRRLLTERAFAVARLGTDVSPTEGTLGALRDYAVELTKVTPAVLEPQMPPELPLERLGMIELSDSGSWGDVAAWGHSLFALPSRLPPSIEAFAERWRDPHLRRQEVIAGVVQTVQRDVRYLSLALNEGTHRPAPPEVVLARHFGDCKDKSLLTVALLSTLGFDVSPALVSTTFDAVLTDLVPAPTLFDHVIVRLRLGGFDYFLDPTRTFQRGTLEELSVHDLHHALVLEPSSTELVTIAPRTDPRPDVLARLVMTVGSPDKPVLLETKTTYRHEIAVALRTFHAEGQASDFQKQAGRSVTAAYPTAHRVGDAAFADDPSANEVVVRQRFEIPDAWELVDGRQAFLVQAPWQRLAVEPLPAERQSPFALNYPLHVAHQIHVLTTNVRSSPAKHDSREIWPFAFTRDLVGKPDGVFLDYDLTTRADRVEPSKFEEYRKASAELYRVAGYSLTIRPPIAPRSPVWLFVGAGAWGVFLLGAMALLLRYRPYLRLSAVPYQPMRAGRGGPLVLVGIGVFLTPLVVAYSLFKGAKVFGAVSWSLLTDPASRTYDANWAPALAFALFYQVLVIVAGPVVAFLFWRRHRSFPLSSVALNGASAVFLVLEAWFRPAALAAKSSALSPATAVAVCVAWIAYLLRSRRVKATFLAAEVAPEAGGARTSDEDWIKRW